MKDSQGELEQYGRTLCIRINGVTNGWKWDIKRCFAKCWINYWKIQQWNTRRYNRQGQSGVKRKSIIVCVFIDLSKAFDTFNHNILLTKSKYCGINGKYLKLPFYFKATLLVLGYCIAYNLLTWNLTMK